MAEIKNLKKAASRFLKAAKKKEKIIIYSDSDLDGVASAIIFKDAIKNIGGNIGEIYFPDRESEGYGITKESLKSLKKNAPAILVSLDCGIGSVDEVDLAKKMGFEVVIIDHHEILDRLPKANIIVDPKQKGDKYPFKQLANVGLVFKLAEVLLKNKITDNLRQDFMLLAAMATIADMMPKKDDNELIITEGITYLESSWRPGIKALLESIDSALGLMDKVYKMNSYLNIRDVENKMPGSFRLLTASSEDEAKELAKKLINKADEKKRKVKDIVDEVKSMVSVKRKGEPIIFEGNSNWELVLLGIAASLLVKEYKKPVFLYKKMASESHGSVRMPEGGNSVEAMKKFGKKLITYGGHPMASGFRVKNKYLDEFKESLIDYYS